MEEREKKILAEDILKIVSSDHYNGKIVWTDLIRELRQNWLYSYVKLEHRWSLNAGFINSELRDIIEKEGFTVTVRISKDGFPTATFVGI